MTGELSGRFFDICSGTIASVLDTIQSELTPANINFRTRYLVIPRNPNVSTIRVVRHHGTSSEEIPEDAVNGWTYVGGPMTVNTIDFPINMNAQTGYVIELHGGAKITGSDQGEVQY